MIRAHHHVTWTLLLAIPVLIGWTAWAQNEAAPAGLKIAVVNVHKIFAGLDEHKAIENELKSLNEQIKKALIDKDTQVKNLEKSLQLGALKPGSEQHTKAMDDLALKRLELETIRKYGQVKTTRQTTRRLAELYKHTLEAVDKIGKDKGYDLILHQLDRSTIKGATPRQLSDRIDSHHVLFASSRIDLTEYVKNVLNNTYNTNKKAAPKP